MHFTLLTVVISHLLFDVLSIQTWYYPAYANSDPMYFKVPLMKATSAIESNEMTFENINQWVRSSSTKEANKVIHDLYSIISYTRMDLLIYMEMLKLLAGRKISENKWSILMTRNALYGVDSMFHQLNEKNIFFFGSILYSVAYTSELINSESLSVPSNLPNEEPVGAPINVASQIPEGFKKWVRELLKIAIKPERSDRVFAKSEVGILNFPRLGLSLSRYEYGFEISSLKLGSHELGEIFKGKYGGVLRSKGVPLLLVQLFYKLFDEEQIIKFNHYMFTKVSQLMSKGMGQKKREEDYLIKIERKILNFPDRMESILTFQRGMGILEKVVSRKKTETRVNKVTDTLENERPNENLRSKIENFQDILQDMKMQNSFHLHETNVLYSNFLSGSKGKLLNVFNKLDEFLNQLMNEWPMLVHIRSPFTMSQQYIAFKASILHLVRDLLDHQGLSLGATYGDPQFGVHFIVEDTFRVRFHFQPVIDLALVNKMLTAKSPKQASLKTVYLEFLRVLRIWNMHLLDHFLDLLDSAFIDWQLFKKLLYSNDYAELLKKLLAASTAVKVEGKKKKKAWWRFSRKPLI